MRRSPNHACARWWVSLTISPHNPLAACGRALVIGDFLEECRFGRLCIVGAATRSRLLGRHGLRTQANHGERAAIRPGPVDHRYQIRAAPLIGVSLEKYAR